MRRLIALSLLLTGCATVPIDTGYAPAFYQVQGQDIRGTGEDLSQYGLLVCNPDLDPATVQAASPDAIVLAYHDARWVAATPAEGGWGGPGTVQAIQRTYFLESDYQHGKAGERVQVWKGGWEVAYTRSNADKMAKFIGTNLRDWEGIYLDDLHTALPDTVRRALGIPKAAEWDRLVADWIMYRDALVAGLRTEGFTVIVGNIGYVPNVESLPAVDGYCTEEWWPANREAFVEHCLAPGVRRDLCVAWEWEPGDKIRTGNIRYR